MSPDVNARHYFSRGVRNFCNRSMRPLRRFHITRALLRFSRPYKVHLGCGDRIFRDWLNLDAHPGSGGLTWLADDGLPFGNSCVDAIYHEHFLEHLDVATALVLLRECARVLSPEGCMRVAMPNLATLIELCVSDQWREQEWLKQPEYLTIKTRAEMCNWFFRGWGHRWIYDYEELERRLCEAGFRWVVPVDWGTSENPALCGLETRRDSRLVVEAGVARRGAR